MSYDLVEIAGRVQRLERDNRRLKLGAGALVAVLVALPLVAAVLPAQVPEVIEARAFRVLDEQGTIRAGLAARGLGFYDEQGTVRAAVAAGQSGLPSTTSRGRYARPFLKTDWASTTSRGRYARPFLKTDWASTTSRGRYATALEDGLGFYDEQGTARVTLRADGLLRVRDDQGTPRAVFDAGSLFFNDEQGTTRLQLGRITLVNPSTKAETKYPASSVVLFDEAGAVIERLPR